MTLKLQTNPKILIGSTIQLTGSAFYFVAVAALGRAPQPILWTFKFCIVLAIALVYLGIHEERAKRKLVELSNGTLFPEAH